MLADIRNGSKSRRSSPFGARKKSTAVNTSLDPEVRYCGQRVSESLSNMPHCSTWASKRDVLSREVGVLHDEALDEVGSGLGGLPGIVS